MLVFVFVKHKSDYLLIPLLNGCGLILSSAIALYVVSSKLSIKFKLVSITLIKKQFIDGWHVFISTISISLYTFSSTFILGMVGTNTIVGYFSAAEKIINAIKGLYGPIAQSLYPLISRKIFENRDKGINFVSKISAFIFSFYFYIIICDFYIC